MKFQARHLLVESYPPPTPLKWDAANTIQLNLSNNDRTATTFGTGGVHATRATIALPSTKVYWECYFAGSSGNFGANTPFVGIWQQQAPNPIDVNYPSTKAWGVAGNGNVYNENSIGIGTGGQIPDGHTLMFAHDGATSKWWIGRNGSWFGDPAAGTGNAGTTAAGTTRYPLWNQGSGWHPANCSIRGSLSALYSPPSGFAFLGA